MALLTQSILFPLFSDAIVLLVHVLVCLLWVMGFWIWIMGLYLGGCSIETMRQGWHFSLRASSSLFLAIQLLIVLLIHILECLLWDMRYVLWDMGYGIVFGRLLN